MNLSFNSARLDFRPLMDADIELAITLFTDPEVTKYVGELCTEKVHNLNFI
jgi:hypothetical protein